MRTFQFCRVAPGEHTYLPSGSRRAHISPEEDWNFPGKNC